MSFSEKIKNELYDIVPSARHCQIAEMAAVFMLCGSVSAGGDHISISLGSDNERLIRKFFTLAEKSFNISASTDFEDARGHVTIEDPESVRQLVGAFKLEHGCMEAAKLLTNSTCCRRAFIRGAFLTCGCMSTPQISYHMEFVCMDEARADMLLYMLNSFELEETTTARLIRRKKYYVVYLKSGSQIVDMLNIMGAHRSLIELEELRVVKDMNNSINRRVNCETANITKTVHAAVRQVEDIEYLRSHGGLGRLSPPLMEVALLRLEYPEAALKELGDMLEPPVGKSGVNHRLRKISEMADKLRG